MGAAVEQGVVLEGLGEDVERGDGEEDAAAEGVGVVEGARAAVEALAGWVRRGATRGAGAGRARARAAGRAARSRP